MRLARARVQKYRSIKDTGWFELENTKTILVGPNEAGKTALLRALEQLNAGEDVPGFDSLRDYPRSELNDLDTGSVAEKDIIVVSGEFELDADDKAAVSAIWPEAAGCKYQYDRHLDNSYAHRLVDAPATPTYGSIKDDLARLTKHIDKQLAAERAETPPEEEQTTLKEDLDELTADWDSNTALTATVAKPLVEWFDEALPYVDEEVPKEVERHSKLMAQARIGELRKTVLRELHKRLPIFVYFSAYFRVRPLIHLQHLADRLDQNLLDDNEYDFGNVCLLKLLGFTARELSDLGKAPEPEAGDSEALANYRDQLDRRGYKLNGASVRLTNEIQQVWQPDGDRPREREFTVRVTADQQYLKVVVEDDLGVEIELDQRSEGFQWLVSFFTVFFAQASDEYENAILLLDEPGLSLHGLKQRDFRTTVSRLAEGNQILFTTHSPFMVGPDELDAVRVIEMTDRNVGTKVHTSVSAEDSASIQVLQEALGYDLAQSLFMEQRNLVLEGLTDYWYVDATAALLREAGTADLNEKIALVPAQSAGKVVYFATILHAHRLKVAALLDSDAAGDQAASQDTLVHMLGNKNILRTKDAYKGAVSKPEIEDMLRKTLVVVGKDELGWDVKDKGASQPGRPIVDVFADAIGTDFSKYRLAKAYLRWTRAHAAADLTDAEREQWAKLISAVNKALK